MKITFDISTQANIELATKVLDVIQQCLIPAPATVFGKVDAPLVPAPSTAVVEPPVIAPVVQAVGTPPPPPVAPPAPATPAATSSAPALVVDSEGMPWDERIHAGTKQKIANGSWRKKKGVDPSLVLQVEAELKGFAALATPAPAAAPAPVAPPPPVAAAPAPAPVAPPPPAPAAATAPSGLSPFTQLIVDTSKAINKKTLTPGDVIEACQAVGLANIGELNGQPHLIDSVRALLADKL